MVYNVRNCSSGRGDGSASRLRSVGPGRGTVPVTGFPAELADEVGSGVMSEPEAEPGRDTEPYPGESLGLPESGRGALASWRARFAALLLDWGTSMIVAVFAFGVGVMREGGWRAWMILAVFFVQKSVLTALAGGSFGQIIARIQVVRLDGEPLGWWRAIVRTAMVCVVLPAVVVGAERRGLDDLALGTVVVRRR